MTRERRESLIANREVRSGAAGARRMGPKRAPTRSGLRLTAVRLRLGRHSVAPLAPTLAPLLAPLLALLPQLFEARALLGREDA